MADPLLKVTRVHCARIAQQSQFQSTVRLEIARRFEHLDKRHLGVASQDMAYFEFLNLAYQHEHLKREHLWMAFRYLAEAGDDQHSLITAESLRRRLVMMDWHRSCQLRIVN